MTTKDTENGLGGEIALQRARIFLGVRQVRASPWTYSSTISGSSHEELDSLAQELSGLVAVDALPRGHFSVPFVVLFVLCECCCSPAAHRCRPAVLPAHALIDVDSASRRPSPMRASSVIPRTSRMSSTLYAAAVPNAKARSCARISTEIGRLACV